MVGTLPPLKGISYYCLELCRAVSKKADLQFIGFRELYPASLHRGGATTSELPPASIDDVDVRNIISYSNPTTSIQAALSVRGRILHVQHWAYPLVLLYLPIILINRLRQRRVIVTIHNVLPHENRIFGWIANLLILLLSHEAIVHNVSNLNRLIGLYPVRRDRVHVIPHGTLVPLKRTGISMNDARSRLGLCPHDKVILFFGNIRDYKGLDVLLHSARLVADHVAHLRLLIAGTFWRNWQHYAKLVDKYQLREVVVSRTGYIPDDEVELYFTSADLIALPYRRLDSDSGVAAMAIGFGKALIVTNVGGLPSYVLRREGLCNPGDPSDLAHKITRILSDNSLREEMSQDSEVLSERRSWEQIAERTLTLYRNVTNPAGAETDREDAPPTREILSGSVSGGRVSLHKQL